MQEAIFEKQEVIDPKRKATRQALDLLLSKDLPLNNGIYSEASSPKLESFFTNVGFTASEAVRIINGLARYTESIRGKDVENFSPLQEFNYSRTKKVLNNIANLDEVTKETLRQAHANPEAHSLNEIFGLNYKGSIKPSKLANALCRRFAQPPEEHEITLHFIPPSEGWNLAQFILDQGNEKISHNLTGEDRGSSFRNRETNNELERADRASDGYLR